MDHEPLMGLQFLAADYATAARWAERAAKYGYGVEIVDLGTIPEAVCIRLPGGDQDGFAVYRALSGRYLAADWRPMAGCPETPYATLEAALNAVTEAVNRSGSNGVMPSFGVWG